MRTERRRRGRRETSNVATRATRGRRAEGAAYAIESSLWNDWGSLDIMHYVWAYVTAPAARHASPPRRSSWCTTRSAIPQHERELATPSNRRSRGLIPAKAPCSGNFDLYILHTDPAMSACGCSRYFPVVCRRVTFLIVIRHTDTRDVRARGALRYIDTRVYPVPHYAIREKPTSYADHVEARIKKKKDVMFWI